jgi:hypothetical protein
MKTRLAVLIPALAILAFAAPAGAATTTGSTSAAVSENWAGYEATTTNSSGFTAASGSWVQPTVSATTQGTYSAYWVGLGGGGENSSALEQEGTQADVSSTGKVSYYAWYELVPSAPVKIKSVSVHPGDRIWARTAVKGDKVTVEVDNKTTGQDFKKTLTMTAATPDTSTAEWVAEAPSECQGGTSGQCTPLPLSNFGSVKFTNAYATSNGQTKSVSGWTDTAIELSPSSSSNFGVGGGYGGGFGSTETAGAASTSEGAAPGALSSDGTAFTVTYGAEDTTTASSTTGTSGVTGTSGYGSTGTSGYGYGYGASGYGDSGYGASGYGTSGYGDSGYGYGYGASGYGDSGYGYGYGSYTAPYSVYGNSYPAESYGGSYGSAVYAY